MTFRVRIKNGAPVFQDFAFGKWPAHREALDGRPFDPRMIFDAEIKAGRYWDCRAPGFGQIGDYGSGSIFVNDLQGVEQA